MAKSFITEAIEPWNEALAKGLAAQIEKREESLREPHTRSMSVAEGITQQLVDFDAKTLAVGLFGPG